MWNQTALSKLLNIQYPIIQGAFGGGLTSPALVAEVANCGGLGSFGFQGLGPETIRTTIAEIRSLTKHPFAANLWVSTEDAGSESVTAEEYQAALAPLLPFYQELALTPPSFAERSWPSFDEQVAAVLEAAPPVFSFIFGIPPAAVVAECKRRKIIMLGTATTVDEAIELESAGVDAIVATGSDAGGHRASFLRSAEASLTGTFSLIPQVVDAVRVPVIAAGGIADGRGVVAALALGASAAQIGTAFLATVESNAIDAHREALRSDRAKHTVLTRSFSGRLGRGLSNAVLEMLEAAQAPVLPYPLQSQLSAGLRPEAIRRERFELVSFWAGQAAPLIRHDSAQGLFEGVVQEVERNLSVLAQLAPRRGC